MREFFCWGCLDGFVSLSENLWNDLSRCMLISIYTLWLAHALTINPFFESTNHHIHRTNLVIILWYWLNLVIWSSKPEDASPRCMCIRMRIGFTKLSRKDQLPAGRLVHLRVTFDSRVTEGFGDKSRLNCHVSRNVEVALEDAPLTEIRCSAFLLHFSINKSIETKLMGL